MAIVEGTVNVALGAALGRRHPVWEVDAEQTGQLDSGDVTADTRRVDIVIHLKRRGVVPVLIEAEFAPAASVEADADRRLGETVKLEGHTVDRVVALRLPEHLKQSSGAALTDAVEAATYEWCLRSGADAKTLADDSEAGVAVTRWPTAGWLTGGVDDLARFCEMLLVDERGLEAAAAIIVNSIDALTESLRSIESDREQMRHVRRVMGEHVDPPDDEDEAVRNKRETQSTQMALMMLANAFLFERVIIDGENPPAAAKRWKKSKQGDTKQEVLDNWNSILAHNYWPIFTIAKDILETCVRDKTAKTDVIRRLTELAERLTDYGVAETGDITGQLFGKLISDRKFLATFYTLPQSAFLMAELVASRLDERGLAPTGPGEALRQLRIADLACGTGALLTSLYQRLATRIRSAGADDARCHKDFIEHVFQAVDVMPAAAHITATLLASAHPNVVFDRSNVVLAPYGLPPAETVPAYLAVMADNGVLVADPTASATSSEILDALKATAASLGAAEPTTDGWNEQMVADHLPAVVKGVRCRSQPADTWSGLRLDTQATTSALPSKQTPAAVRRRVRVGSLDLLDETHEVSNRLVPSEDAQIAMAATGERPTASLPHGTLDVCVMNPPFTSNTSDRKDDTPPFPEFAGLGNPEGAQDAMKAQKEMLKRKRSKALRQPRVDNLRLEPAANGNAGLASNFIDLADAKLKDDGVVGLILPQKMLAGESWKKTRALLMARYDDIVVLTIGATGSEDRAFSADTGMGECMVIATRTTAGTDEGRNVTYVTLRRRPTTLIEGVEVARRICDAVRDDTPRVDGGVLEVGGDDCGSWFRDNSLSGIAEGAHNLVLVAAARHLQRGTLALPRDRERTLAIVPLGELGTRGPLHRDIGNHVGDVAQRGPLHIHSKPASQQRLSWQLYTYPALWNQDASQETSLEVLPDCEGQLKPGEPAGEDGRAWHLWNDHVARLHLNLGLGFNSQPLAACLTPEPCLGGRSWPTFRLADPKWEYAAVLWHNCTLGLLLWWSQGGRQQLGRSDLTITQLDDLPTLDYRALSDTQHDKAKEIYERFITVDTKLTLLPASEAYRDAARQQLDRAVLHELLGFDWSDIEGPLDTLRHQWCAEPTVNGGKTTRPGYQREPKTA